VQRYSNMAVIDLSDLIRTCWHPYIVRPSMFVDFKSIVEIWFTCQ